MKLFSKKKCSVRVCERGREWRKNWKIFVIIKIFKIEIKEKEESYGENWERIFFFRDFEMKEVVYEIEGGKKIWKKIKNKSFK